MTEKTKNIGIEEVLPSVSQGWGSVGFFFGAGTSVEAGFPVLSQLTLKVFQQLSQAERNVIRHVMKQHSLSLPDENGSPNIEEIADCLQDHLLRMSAGVEKQAIEQAEDSLRKGIVDVLDNIENPNLNHHIRFFETLKKLLDGRSKTVWIVTTNYDRCLEIAASRAGVNLVDGFLGTTLRYFAPTSFQYDLTTPSKENRAQLSPWKAPTVKLIKLHGSLDWWADGSSAFASSNKYHHPQDCQRSLVLPRKKKQSDTLEYPYSDFFDVAASMLGGECKYLITCGYRFADDHINRRLLLPKLRSGELRICALQSHVGENLAAFQKLGSFNLLTPERSIINGKESDRTSESWKFSNLVGEIAKYTGE